MDRSIDRRPLILLDLDGVINDLGSLAGMKRPWRVDIVRSHGYTVHIPSYMPALIRALADLAEIHWLTTWRHRANDAVADHLGAGRFPVIDDGTGDRHVDWKPAAAFAVAGEAIEAGRPVIWIEDFGGFIPRDEMPAGVVFVDTVGEDFRDAVLRPEVVAGLLASYRTGNRVGGDFRTGVDRGWDAWETVRGVRNGVAGAHFPVAHLLHEVRELREALESSLPDELATLSGLMASDERPETYDDLESFYDAYLESRDLIDDACRALDAAYRVLSRRWPT